MVKDSRIVQNPFVLDPSVRPPVVQTPEPSHRIGESKGVNMVLLYLLWRRVSTKVRDDRVTRRDVYFSVGALVPRVTYELQTSPKFTKVTKVICCNDLNCLVYRTLIQSIIEKTYVTSSKSPVQPGYSV